MTKTDIKRITEFIHEICSIDIEAAEYILLWMQRKEYPEKWYIDKLKEKNVMGLFVWQYTPQGNGYWHDIYKNHTRLFTPK